MINVHDYYFQLFQLFLRQLFLICNFQKNRFTQASLCAIIHKLCVKNAKNASTQKQRKQQRAVRIFVPMLCGRTLRPPRGIR